tara:strand:- start:206 stop:421 length:216 start_codon:yes stop_codon:yes gene_type:complete
MIAMTINYLCESLSLGVEFGLGLSNFGIKISDLDIVPNRGLDVKNSNCRVFVNQLDIELLESGKISLKKVM